MNNYHLFRLMKPILGVAVLLAACNGRAAALSAFTYQGRLNADGGPASGQYDFEFRLFGVETNGTALAGPASASAVWVTNGAFQASIDFGPGVFNGEARWLEIAVQCTACDGLPVTLSPRQAITATPYALHAVNAGGLMGFLNEPLDITINGERVMRYEPATSPTLGFMPNIIGGVGSYVTTQNHGVTVAGGGFHDVEDQSYFSTVSGGMSNRVSSQVASATIGGGINNLIDTPVGRPIRGASVVGGWFNQIHSSDYAVIGGGRSNIIELGSKGAVIAGGEGNRTDVWGLDVTISGGASNLVGWYNHGSTIGGGVRNRSGADAWYSTIGGGLENAAGARDSRGATIGGGVGNAMNSYTDVPTIAGGQGNYIDHHTRGATIGGGTSNRIRGTDLGDSSARLPAGVIAGGSGNTLGIDAKLGVISGGESNQANGPYSTVSGGAGNLVNSNTINATIGGGSGNGISSFPPFGVLSRNGTIAGGAANGILHADHAVIGGGVSNFVWYGSGGAFIGGGDRNLISEYSGHAVIAGGAGNLVGHMTVGSTISGGVTNLADYHSRFSTIGGGAGNVAGAFSSVGATVGGGLGNESRGLFFGTIAGGESNKIRPNTRHATIGGGSGNLIESGSMPVAGGTIGGGQGNFIGSGATAAVISGGESNQANGPYSTVAGGRLNIAGGTNSFAAGFRARATNDGTFVWADSEDTDFTSTGTNQFLIRASGGVGINTDSPGFDLHVNGTAGKPGGGAWSVPSDERLKKDIRPLEQALARLLQLHGVTYEYKNPESIHELSGQQTGMIAQEVEKVFPEWVETGRDGMKRLSVRGFEALAVEALRELRNEKDAQLSAMEKRLAAIEARLNEQATK